MVSVQPDRADLLADFKPPLLALALAMSVQCLVGVLAVFVDEQPLLSIANKAVLGTYLLYAVILGDWALGRFVPGAADNASGCAAALTLAEAWSRQPREGVELVVLLPGCEEDGMLGSMAWADRHREELDAVPTLFLNFDCLGVGPPRFFSDEIRLIGWPVAYPPDIVELTRDTASQLGLKDAGPHTMPGPTDGLTFLQRGLRGMTIVGFRNWGHMPTYHRLHDTAENLDFDEAWRGVTLGWELLDRLVVKELAKELNAEAEYAPQPLPALVTSTPAQTLAK